MWNRVCPLCFAKVPRTLVMTQADELTCPSCHAQLELSRPSRVLDAFVGLLFGFTAFHFVLLSSSRGSWFVSLIVAILAYGLGSAGTLLFFSDLVVRPLASSGNFPQIHE